MSELPQVTIYCDGAAVPNPGIGGWGAVLIHGQHIKELRGSVAHASNNAMEITAAIEGLNALTKPCQVTLISDSQYLINTMSLGWSRNKNVELWDLLDRAARTHTVTWEWVRGHTGNRHNERAHDLATQAIREVTHSW